MMFQKRIKKRSTISVIFMAFCIVVGSCHCDKLPLNAVCAVDNECQSQFCYNGRCSLGRERELFEQQDASELATFEEKSLNELLYVEAPNCLPGQQRSCYTGAPETKGKGNCKSGLQHCKGGSWGSCVGEITPQPEICNGKDDNCNGIIDEGAISNRLLKSGEVGICKGTFIMGSPPDEKGRLSNEGPQHQVTLTRSFAMFRYEVTQKEFQKLMGYNLSFLCQDCPDAPVDSINAYTAMAFCNALSKERSLPSCFNCKVVRCENDKDCKKYRTVCMNGICMLDFRYLKVKSLYCEINSEYRGNNYYNCKGYRLPTEAEWEYAARAGEKNSRYGPLEEISWCAPFDSSTHPVGHKKPNVWGLYDVFGNVTEWVYDGLRSYTSRAVIDPLYLNPVEESMGYRGCFNGMMEERCRFAFRMAGAPETPQPPNGFRPVRTLFPAKEKESLVEKVCDGGESFAEKDLFDPRGP